MKKVILACNAGMSTGIMQMKLQEQAQKHNKDVEFEAVPVSEIVGDMPEVVCIILGPQVRFAKDEVQATTGGKIPVFAMDAQDFGLMRADKVWIKLEKYLPE